MPTNVVRPCRRSSALCDGPVRPEYEAVVSTSLKMPLPAVSKPTGYLLYIVFIVTLGPLQFGFHLVKISFFTFVLMAG
jgi:hypothetical protein